MFSLLDGRQGVCLKRTFAFALALFWLAQFWVIGPVAAQKHKWKSKEKKEKRFEPVVKADPRAYAGRYVGIDETYVLEIEADAEGHLKITSSEGPRRAELKDIRLDGARLTGTLVYEDGRTAKFDAFFADRVLNGERTFGVLVSGTDIKIDGLAIDRTFYRLFTR